MVKNITYQNRLALEENTPLVTIIETKIDTKQARAVDSRQAVYDIDLTKASFGGIYYPVPGTQWFLKKISGVWSLMARAGQQNPQLNPGYTPVPGETYIGGEGTTYITGDLEVAGVITSGGGGGGDIAFHAVGDADTDEGHTSMVEGDDFKRHIIYDSGDMEWGSGAIAPDTNLYRSAVNSLATDGNFRTTGDIYSFGEINSTEALTVQEFGEAEPRSALTDTAQLLFSDGTNAADVTLYRLAANQLGTDDEFVIQRTTTTGAALSTKDDGDTNTRLAIDVSGKMEWGAGGVAAKDVVLERGGADILKLHDELLVQRTTTTGIALETQDDGDSVTRFYMDVSGAMEWGDGSATRDVSLFRAAADTLRTNDTMQANSFQLLISGTYRSLNFRANTASGTTDGSGNLTVTHGCGTTPVVVWCQGINATSGADNIFMGSVGSIGATTFVVRLARSDGSTLNTKSVNVQYVAWF